MIQFAVQYLEDNPEIVSITPEQARRKIRAACELLPISTVLLGWHLPEALLEACREETKRAGAAFYRWHPLLTSDGEFQPRAEWQTIGLQGEPVPGFQARPEFTFICPNRPAVQDAIFEHLHQLIRHNDYDGIFLDRMRFPSPAADPSRWLACFCEDCQRAAANVDLDLKAAQWRIQQLLTKAPALPSFIQTLFNGQVADASAPELVQLRQFLAFRTHSITKFIEAVAALVHGEGLAVGLDCFSAALTHMVGQDLALLAPCADWTKVMSYCHTLGPAGLPFELLDLANWLIEERQVPAPTALAWLTQATGLPIPESRAQLRTSGLPAPALLIEMQRARAAGIQQLWAGIELVEIEGVAQLETKQIEADHQVLRQSPIDGLALSWDLWHMTSERLQLVHALWS